MSNQSKVIWAIVIVIAVVALVYWLTAQPTSAPQNQQAQQTQTPQNQTTNATVTYTDSGFSPSSITIKVGGAVTWVNNASDAMWVASNIHPTHTLYSGTTLSQHCPDATNSAFDSCKSIASSSSWSFKFDKTGTWKYHNHLDPGETGNVTVTQ